MKTIKTRYSGLAITYYCRIWRFVDVETGAVIGDVYRSKAEIMADLTRFAVERGFTC